LAVVAADGILSGPIDLDGRRRVAAHYPPYEAHPGTEVVERSTGARLVVVSVNPTQVIARDAVGAKRKFRNHPGAFEVDRRAVTLVAPRPRGGSAPAARTASGSVAAPSAPAKVARASRILVEGVHDAELLERVWGDDLRHEGVVVERLDGMDHLDAALRELRPAAGRRVGVLLDHLVDGSKEARAAAALRSEHVLVTGHPYVDVWQAVKPGAVGISAWPDVPLGVPWKDGVCVALGWPDPRDAWRRVLAAIRDWNDLETPLVNAVERLIDFVTAD
jgi:hypothetical protein